MAVWLTRPTLIAGPAAAVPSGATTSEVAAASTPSQPVAEQPPVSRTLPSGSDVARWTARGSPMSSGASARVGSEVGLGLGRSAVSVVHPQASRAMASTPGTIRERRTAMAQCASLRPMTDANRLGVEELAERAGMSVRTVRFYAGRGLIPPPLMQGRVGSYGADHLARLELVRELQAHGFTLAAIERYLARIPADATAQDIALHRTLLAPWAPDLPETVGRDELERRAGRPLDDSDVEVLVALGVVEPTPDDGVFRVAPAHLGLGVEMLDLGLSVEAAAAVQRVFAAHGRAIAEELTELFRSQVWPALRERDYPPERIQAIVERFKPVTVQALVMAYESAVDETKRDTIRRRA